MPNLQNPKPDIVLHQDLTDPLYKAIKRHFAQLMSKFSYPIYVFNLTKKNNHREQIVANEYQKAVNEVINADLPKPIKIQYHHYDVKAKKKEERNFPLGLFELYKEAFSKIGFFHVESSKASASKVTLQRGVMRTNCIDSLDRTNFAQQMFGYFTSLH